MTDTAERIRVEDFETKEIDGKRVDNPEGIVQRWFAELALASREEKDWRSEVHHIWERYRNEKQKAARQNATEASFNILWSNTEIMVPSLYNSTPAPDVRRRFRDPDPIGKVVATVLERALIYEIDSYDFDEPTLGAVIDVCLTGRGIARIRYRPTVEQEELEAQPVEPPELDESGQPVMGDPETVDRVTRQETPCEHVQWNDFRRGPGKVWSAVQWVAFRHDMTYDDLVEYFGEEKADAVALTGLSDDDAEGMPAESKVKQLFQSGEVWEIWDKAKERVLFITRGMPEPLKVEEPDLKLQGFFPMPRPAMAILDSGSLEPIPLYRQYRGQADEIDRLTRRIEKVTHAIRVRGAYLANVKEGQAIMDAGDNEMIAIEDAGALVASNISLDKLIWIMPVDMLVRVLEALYKARDQVKQVIYEIIGLSDIMRGATKATETLGAQELKSQWGSIRLQRMQREIQRFVRDLLRLKAEVIAEHYEPRILAEMTQVQLLSAQEKQMLTLGVQQMQQQGREVPPQYLEQLSRPSWDEVIQVLRSDTLRQYRVTIETDSTIVQMVDRDMQGMNQLIEGVGAIFAAIPGLQAAGAQNASEVVKDVALAFVRHSSLGGRSFEDAIEQLEFAGGSQMDEIQQAIEQLGQAVQQGGEQIQQIGQQVGQHQEILGQLIQTLQAQPGHVGGHVGG